jgi:hypothetical protein
VVKFFLAEELARRRHGSLKWQLPDTHRAWLDATPSACEHGYHELTCRAAPPCAAWRARCWLSATFV